ncbi:MAG: hypothetical protein NVSMB45_13050 [Ginsengibacter sp.]
MVHKKHSMKILLSLTFLVSIYSTALSQNKTVSLNHIALDVTQLQKSGWFYHTIIGLDTIANPFNDHRHIWYKIGEHAQLHLIEVKTETSIHYKGTHVCFTVPSIEEVVSKLNQYKIHYENWLGVENTFTIRPDGVKQIYFQDPDGYWIEINNDRF